MRRFAVTQMALVALGAFAVQFLSVAPAALSQTASPSPSPASASQASPVPFALGTPHPTPAANQDVIVLLGAGDAATSGRLVASTANRLAQYQLINDAIVVPEPTWTLNDFVAACKIDDTVAGALIVTLIAAASGSRDWFAWRRSTVQLAGGAIWIACDTSSQPNTSGTHSPAPSKYDATVDQPDKVSYSTWCVKNAVRHSTAVTIAQAQLNQCSLPTPSPPPKGGVPKIAWVSPVAYSNDHISLLELLTPLTFALAAASVYETFRPSITTGSSATTVFPTPAPIPHKGAVGSITSSNSTTTNPGGELGAISTGLYTQAFAYTNNAVSLPIGDEQSWRAANGVVSGIVGSINCKLKAKTSASPPPSFPAFEPLEPDNTSYPDQRAQFSSAPFCK